MYTPRMRPPPSLPGEGVRIEANFNKMERFRRRKAKHLPMIRAVMLSGGTIAQAVKATGQPRPFVTKVIEQECLRNIAKH